MTAAQRQVRGTKRTCQNQECRLYFYDLNREAIVCPHCHSAFAVPVVSNPPPYSRPFSRRPSFSPKVPVFDAAEAAVPDEDEPVEASKEDVILESDDEDEMLNVETGEPMDEKKDD